MPEGHGLRDSFPEDDKDYQVPFRFTGKIDKQTVKLGPEELSAVEKGMIGKKFRNRQ